MFRVFLLIGKNVTFLAEVIILRSRIAVFRMSTCQTQLIWWICLLLGECSEKPVRRISCSN